MSIRKDPVREQRKYNRTTKEDARRWADKYQNRISIVKIAEQEGVDPGTVSAWLRKSGIVIGRGHHFVAQPRLAYSDIMKEWFTKGQKAILDFIRERTWGIQASKIGSDQLAKFCQFVVLYEHGYGVKEIARAIKVHRSSVSGWREGRDQPYLVKVLCAIADAGAVRPGWRFLPMRLSSGANELRHWIQVPLAISDFSNIVDVLQQLQFAAETETRARRFGFTERLLEVRPELFGYALGMMVGDAGKRGGQQTRVRSMNVDIQLTRLQPSNEALGEFACLCLNSLGIGIRRIKDKEPSGTQLTGRQPTPAFRWTSDRSPFLAWVFTACLGLNLGQNTSTHPVRMEWIHSCPRSFRWRFVQAIADSDGSVKRSGVVITSVPNADFVTRVLKGLGLVSAHTVFENGVKLRTYVNSVEAARLPLFNESVMGYRYGQLMSSRESH